MVFNSKPNNGRQIQQTHRLIWRPTKRWSHYPSRHGTHPQLIPNHHLGETVGWHVHEFHGPPSLAHLSKHDWAVPCFLFRRSPFGPPAGTPSVTISPSAGAERIVCAVSAGVHRPCSISPTRRVRPSMNITDILNSLYSRGRRERRSMTPDSLCDSFVFQLTSSRTIKLAWIVSKDSEEETGSYSPGSDLGSWVWGGLCLNMASWMHFR